MSEWSVWISVISIFGLLALSSNTISKWLAKYRFPLITGLLVTGMIIGPHVLGIFKVSDIQKLTFLLDFSLAYIAFAAGAEFYLKDLRGDLTGIKWNTIAQIVITFIVGTLGVYILAPHIPMLEGRPRRFVWSVSLLFATIFVARSPSSAIAIIRELRAKGPFTRTLMGVTVIIDVLVVVLFAIILSLATSLLSGTSFEWMTIVQVILEISVAIGLGFLLGRFLNFVLKQNISRPVKTAIVLLSGLSVYIAEHDAVHFALQHYGIHMHLEPLLICIVASFYVTNFTPSRPEFHEILDKNGPWIFVVFFTLTGATLSLDVIIKVYWIAIILFVIRMIGLVLGSYIGGFLAKDPPKTRHYGWMPYVTQAGVGIGLAAEVEELFPEWGNTFFTIIIGMIIISQIIGPILFKRSITAVGEDHTRANSQDLGGERRVIIYGFEDQAILLARRFQASGWEVKIATKLDRRQIREVKGVEIIHYSRISEEELRKLGSDKIEGAVLFNSDENNVKLAELLYEKFGVENIVTRVTDRKYMEAFTALGVKVVEPVGALVNLIEHYVRSPQTTALVLGEEEGQDSMDIEVRDKMLHGALLRHLRLPSDVLILSVKRKGQVLITHGYTRLRLGDILTVVGSKESLEDMKRMLG